MTTLLLAHYPFGELLSDFVLREATASLELPPGTLLAAPDWAQRRAEALGLRLVPPESDPVALGVRHVVLAGAFTALPALAAALEAARAVVEDGGTFMVHNLSLEGSANRREAPPEAAILDAATRITARDHRTANLLTLWRVGRGIPILSYPERRIPHDPTLLHGLDLRPGERPLGVCVRGGADVRAAWRDRLPEIRAALLPFAGWPVLPLPAAPPALSGDTDDASGTRDFIEAVWPGARLLLPGMLVRSWWQSKVTPARYLGLLGACGAVVTQRDLPVSLAVEARIPVLALILGTDRRVLTCVATLANELPPGSKVLNPEPG